MYFKIKPKDESKEPVRQERSQNVLDWVFIIIGLLIVLRLLASMLDVVLNG